MSGNKLDLADLNDVTLDDLPSAPPTFPEGDYTGVFREVQARTSQNGRPYTMFSFVITEGEYTGKRANAMFMLDKENVWRIKKSIFRPLGFDDGLALGDAVGLLEGAVVTAKVGIKKNMDGDDENVVRKVYAPA